MIKKRLYPMLLLIFMSINSWGQTEATAIIPPAPTAAALGKYGDIPVSTYTGVPSIKIPLYEIKSGNLTLPISLSYHASGIKVEEIASSAGLGWSLNAGGVITRTLRGKADENGYFTDMPKLLTYRDEGSLAYVSQTEVISDAHLQEVKDFLVGINNGDYDVEPDLFYLNFPAGSARMVFTPEREPRFIPHNNWLVEPTIATGSTTEEPVFLAANGNYQAGFKVTSPDGTRYFFNQLEQTTFTTGQGGAQESSTHTSSWFLTRMESAQTDDFIAFVYSDAKHCADGSCAVDQDVVKSVYRKVLDPMEDPRCDNPAEYQQFYSQASHWVQPLSEIIFKEGRLKFHYDTPREDLPGDYRLDAIEVFDTGGNPIKALQMSYTYSGSGTGPQDKRLVLNMVTETGAHGESKPPYLMKYNTTPLPPRNSTSQDHWGYYNGAPNNSLLPSYRDPAGNLVSGADRGPDEHYMKAGILEKIFYPTGGVTSFHYEANHYASPNGKLVGQRISIVAENPDGAGVDNTLCVLCEDSSEKLFTVTDLETPGQVSLYPRILRPDGSTAPANETSIVLYKEGQAAPLAIFDDSNQNQGTYLEGFTNGNYRLEAKALVPGSRVYLTVTWNEKTNQVDNKPAGGLRIAKIVTDANGDHSPELERSYKYTLVDNPVKSSGFLVASRLPRYTARKLEKYHEDQDGLGYDLYTCSYTEITSYSKSFLGATQGSPVGYKEVTEYYEENGRGGKTERFFTSQRDDLIAPNPPINHQPSSNEWRRGHLEKEVRYAYDETAQAHKKVYELENNYTFITTPETDSLFYDAIHTSSWGLKSQLVSTYIGYVPLGIYQNGALINFSFYDELSSWYYLGETIEREFGSNETLISEIRTNYGYTNPNHLQPSTVSTENSDGTILTTRYSYAHDLPGLAISDTLIKEHKITLPIEQQQWTSRGGTDYLTSATYFHYEKAAGQLARLGAISKLLTARPVTDYAGLSDNRFHLSKTYSYNAQGHISSIRDPLKGTITSFIWNQQARYPEAVIENARPEQVFYQSFEQAISATTADSKTGERSQFIDAPYHINLGNFSPDETRAYNVSYWFKPEGGDWEHKQYPWDDYAGSAVTINETNGYLDEVRISPAGSEVETYYYKPLTGILTRMDNNNQLTRYEYNGLQQLFNIYDHDRNILKNYRYEYYQEN